MGKGDNRRPCLIPKEQYDQNFESVFGKKKLNVMSDDDRQDMEQDLRNMIHDPCCGCPGCLKDCYDDRDREAGGDVPPNGHEGGNLHAEGRNDADEEPSSWEDEPFWQKSGYRGEYICPHGVGHGNHVHGCCDSKCCQRTDFPLRGAR